MQSDKIYAVRIKTEMMSSSIKVNETVNAVKVDSIKHDGIYVLIDEIDGEEVMSLRRFFINLDHSSYQVIQDNPNYPDTEISNALDILGSGAEKIAPIFITVDPVRDTSEQLKEYVTFFHPRLVGLTGTTEQIKTVTGAYRVYFNKVENNPIYGPPNDI